MEFLEPHIVPATDVLELELVDMYAACIPPKLGGQLMKSLGAIAPLVGMQHAKRVRKSTIEPGKLDILLCPAAAANSTAAGEPGNTVPATESDVLESLPPAVRALAEEHGLAVFVAKVSRHAPKIREQALEWGIDWPLSWRPSDPTAHPQNAELPAHEVEVMKQHMRRAWELAAESAARHGVQNACIIVDARTGRTVAEAADARQRHPLHHAAMQAVAAVAEWQLATWPHAGTKHAQQDAAHAQQQQHQQPPALPPEVLDSKRRRVGDSCDVHGGAAAVAERQGVAACRGSCPQPMEACSAAGEARSSQEQALLPAAMLQGPGRGPAVAPNEAPVGATAAASELGSSGDPGPRPYLCTGYDCYLVHEPCIMCAMALVHSRLRRVVFCVPDERGGALGGSGAKLHAQKSLNHHYHVYRLPLAAPAQPL